jgi:hypothetical protein
VKGDNPAGDLPDGAQATVEAIFNTRECPEAFTPRFPGV